MRVSVFITAALGVVLAGVAIASAADLSNHPVIERVNATQANGTSAHANGTFINALTHSPILRHSHTRSPIFDPGHRPSTSDYNPTPKPVFSVGPYTSARPIFMGGPYMPPNATSYGNVTSSPSSGVLPTMKAADDEEPSYGPDYDKSSAAIITPTKTVTGAAADDEPSYAFPSYGGYPSDPFSDDDDFATGPPSFGAVPTDLFAGAFAGMFDGRGAGVDPDLKVCGIACVAWFKKYCTFSCGNGKPPPAAIDGADADAFTNILEARRNNRKTSTTTTDRYTDHYTDDSSTHYTATAAHPTSCKGCIPFAKKLCKSVCSHS